MGTWGHLPFDNDATTDWAYDLEAIDDLLASRLITVSAVD
jgi:hypothetical protein